MKKAARKDSGMKCKLFRFRMEFYIVEEYVNTGAAFYWKKPGLVFLLILLPAAGVLSSRPVAGEFGGCRYAGPAVAEASMAPGGWLSGDGMNGAPKGQEKNSTVVMEAPAARSDNPDAGPGKKIVVIGSSLAAGWVTSDREQYDFRNGFAYRLARLLKDRGFEVVNASVPGDTTALVLERLEKDVFPLKPDIAFIVLSLGNEGLAGDPVKAVTAYQKGMEEIAARLREKGIRPVIGSCYASNLYTPEHYRILQEVNRWLNSLKLPYINLLGGLEDGNGHFPEDLLFDHSHPGNRGHEELFYAIPPGLFPALAAGRPVPDFTPAGKDGVQNPAVDRALLSFVPDDVMHSFAMAFPVKLEADAPLVRIEAGGEPRFLRQQAGRFGYGPAGRDMLTGPLIADGKWHWIVLSHRHLPGETSVYVDGRLAGRVKESLAPRRLQLGPANSRSACFGGWLIWRAAVTDEEAGFISAGNLWRGSLEVCVPLRELPERSRPVPNLAQSAASVTALAEEPPAALAEIERKIAITEEMRKAEKVFPEKTVCQLPAGAETRYTGVFEIGPDDRISIGWTGKTFQVTDKNMELEIFPESADRFFVKHPLFKIEVVFLELEAGRYCNLQMLINGRLRMEARRPECGKAGAAVD